eukprot:scaffold9782_cov58-Phaeocystis_antarctica.AAC.1
MQSHHEMQSRPGGAAPRRRPARPHASPAAWPCAPASAGAPAHAWPPPPPPPPPPRPPHPPRRARPRAAEEAALGRGRRRGARRSAAPPGAAAPRCRAAPRSSATQPAAGGPAPGCGPHSCLGGRLRAAARRWAPRGTRARARVRPRHAAGEARRGRAPEAGMRQAWAVCMLGMCGVYAVCICCACACAARLGQASDDLRLHRRPQAQQRSVRLSLRKVGRLVVSVAGVGGGPPGGKCSRCKG